MWHTGIYIKACLCRILNFTEKSNPATCLNKYIGVEKQKMTNYKPLQEKAYEYLKKKITDGELAYGQFYSETKMAKEIGISRTPFKDALVRLSQDRYIDIVPSRGFCLHVLSQQDINNTYQSRIAVEGFCALVLHRHRDEAEGAAVIEALEQDMLSMERTIRDKAPFAQILLHDLSFHRRIVDFSKNAQLIKLYESYNHQLYDIALKTFDVPDRPSHALEEHREIFNNITSKSDTAAADAYRSVMKHMEKTKNVVLEVLRQEGNL